MTNLFGKCGCNCTKCPAYIGNIKSDNDRDKCSDGWKKYLNIGARPEICQCLGCQTKDPWQTGYFLPDRSCLVRKCAEHSQLKDCAHCFSFPCAFLQERSKMDYSRKWVEKRVGEKIPDEIYESFVEPYETFKHLQEIRQNLAPAEISPEMKVEPLKVSVAKFPANLDQTDADGKILKNTYDMLVDLLKCNNQTSYIQQVLNKRRIDPALVILWTFAVYGKAEEGDSLKLVIYGEEFGSKEEFKNIVRKADNYWHGSAEQAVILLQGHGLKAEFIPLGRKGWNLALSSSDSERIIGLKMFAQKLVDKFGLPEYTSAWKYTGDAYKFFKKADFTHLS